MTATAPFSPRHAVGLALVAAVALLFPAVAGAASPPDAGDVVSGEAVVRFAPVAPRLRAAAVSRAGGDWGRTVAGVPGARRIELAPGQTVAAGVRALRTQRGVLWAEPNYLMELAAVPNDPHFPSLWGLRNTGQVVLGDTGVAGVDVGTEEAWDTTTGDGDVRVAIVDSGVDPTHPDLTGNLNAALARNFVALDGEPADPGEWGDTNGHGTHVAGTVGAVGDNGLGVAGVNWDVELVPVRVCGLGGSCTSAAVAEGLAYAGDIGAEVANVSLSSQSSEAIGEAIADSPGTLYVVAAGNEGRDVDATPSYPCSLPEGNIVCVAAIDSAGELAWFSNFGDSHVDLGAPGVGVRSTYPNLVTKFDGSGGIAPWDPEPAERWSYLSGSGALAFLDEDKPLPAESSLTSAAAFDLGGGDDCRLTYGLRLDALPPAQALHVEVSTDGSTWTGVQIYSGETPPGEVVPITEDLDDISGETSVRLRFRLTVSEEAQEEALLLRLLRPRVACIDPQAPGGAYAYLQGTSMASPHVAGVAALGWSAHPDVSGVDMRAALLNSVTPTAALAGATATGGRVDAAALLGTLAPEPESGPETELESAPETTPGPEPEPEEAVDSEPLAGWALGLPGARRVPVTVRGRALAWLRCLAARTRLCAGGVTLVGVVRTRRGNRRVVLGARRYALGANRRGLRPVLLRPGAGRLLRARRVGAVFLRIATRQPAGAEPRLRVRATRIALRPPPRRR